MSTNNINDANAMRTNRDIVVNDYNSRRSTTCPAQLVNRCSAKSTCDLNGCTPAQVQYACTAEYYPANDLSQVSGPASAPLAHALN